MNFKKLQTWSLTKELLFSVIIIVFLILCKIIIFFAFLLLFVSIYLIQSKIIRIWQFLAMRSFSVLNNCRNSFYIIER